MSDASGQLADMAVETRIVAVTVYPDGAQIKRVGTLELEAESSVLDIKDLPGTLKPESLQIYIRGTAQVTLQAPQLYPETALPECLQSEKDEAAAQLFQLQGALKACQDRLAILGIQRTFLESLARSTPREFSKGITQHSIGFEDVTAFLQFLDEAYQRLTTEVAQQEQLKEDLAKQLRSAQQHVKQFEEGAIAPRMRLQLPVTVTQPGTLELDVVYTVAQAQWQPVHHVRFGDDLDTLQVDYAAQVQQSTHEPWEEVNLQVSTTSSRVVTLNNSPQSIKWAQEDTAPVPKYIDSRRVKVRSPILEEVYRLMGALPGSEMPPLGSGQQNADGIVPLKDTLVRFTAPNSVTIRSDGSPQRIFLGQLYLKGQLRYRAVPQLCRFLMLQALCPGLPKQWPLLPGQAYLFRGGGYIGQENMEAVPAGKPFQLSLGTDERMPVSRELVAREIQTDTQCRDIRTYRISLHNPLPTMIQVDVIEQMPVTHSERIHVNFLNADPQTSVSEAGCCHWLVSIAPQTDCDIYYKYVIEHPNDVPISDLERKLS